MRHIAAFGVGLVASSLLSACATSSSTHSTSLSETVTAPRPEVRVSSGAVASRLVEEVPTRAGPRVSIRAELANDADSRRVRGIFRVEDDAYVVVGHIDADGVLRIAFPGDPQDDGFVRGNRSYQTNEFFAGFNSQYRFRARTSSIWNTAAAQDAYDRGFGYVFIIASWRPMRFDRFSDGYRWDTFDLASDNYMNDPRPAIQELASRLAGDNSDAYTVQFARYYNTDVIASGYGSGYDFMGSSYGAGFCSGYQPFGYASFGYARAGYPGWGLGYNTWYRGSSYYYDAFGDCYRRSSPYGFGIGYRIVQGPIIPPQRHEPRNFDVTGHRPSPTPPRALPGHYMPQPAERAPGEAQIEHRTAIDHRERTTPADNGAPTVPARRQPRIEAPTPVEHRDRPVMPVETRRAEPREEPQRPRMSIPERVNRPERESPPPARVENPRMEPPRPEPRRSEPPRMAEPRSEPSRPQPSRAEPPKPERRSEQPRSATPRSEPAKPDRKPPQ
jgi:hypothetical protein